MRKQTLALLLALFIGGCGSFNGSTPSGETVYLSKDKSSGTHVYLLRGMGGYALGPGVDQIGARAAKIAGVTQVIVFEYTQTQLVAQLASAEPHSVRVVIGGYSCGANASPVAASGITRSVDELVVIQASIWCGGVPIPTNVRKAQETYNPACVQTAGLGCKLLDLAPGFNPSNFTVIDRPDCHPCADEDPDAQNDMLDAIRSVTNASAAAKYGAALGARVPLAVQHITRYRGQRIYQ